MPPIVLDARTATDHFPGIGRYVVNLASALKRVSPELDLALLRDSSAASQRLALPELPALDCAVSPFRLQQQWQVRSALNRAGAALYHSAYYLMPYRPGVPTVFTCHDLIPLILRQYFSAYQRLIYRFTHQLALNAAQLTIAVSHSTKNDLQRFFRVSSDRIVVVPEGVDDHFKPPSRAELERVRAQYALPGRYLLYFGSNKPHKNVRRLVEAFARSGIRDRTAGIGLVIAGHWDQRYPQAQELAAQLNLTDRVRFIGPVKDADLPALYGGAELFVFPSEYEGFGLPVLEAMACGAPVVCGTGSSLPEVAGDAALLCDPQDVEALARAIEQALVDQDMRAALRQRGLARAAQFSWEQAAQQTLRGYQSLIDT
jgi:glycosyltransferase involved in cell wall biosynthesis